MELSELKTCVAHVIHEQVGCLKKNLRYRTGKVDKATTEIDITIERYGNVDAGLLLVAGVEMPFLKYDCAKRVMKELHRKYPTDAEIIKAVDLLVEGRRG